MFIKRTAYDYILEHLSAKEITFITGPRQAGKTTIMEAVNSELKKRGEKTLFLSLDFEKDAPYFKSQISLIDKINLETGGKDRAFVFIDEIQRKENAGLFLKGIYDMHLPHKFIVSGSGSLELKEKIHESLAGRKRIFEVNPLSFKEFVNFKTDYKYADRLSDYFKIEKETAKKLLLEYLNYGGYPRVAIEETFAKKTGIINEIFQSYIEKDISYLLNVEKIDAFKHLIRILASQSGKLININELSTTLGISAPTIKNYISYAEKTFILRLVTPFYRNIRSEITKSPAVYFNDTGLRNFSIGQFGNIDYFDSAGFIFQNFVFNVLYDKFKYGNSSVHFWRSKDGGEVDFVIDKGNEIIPAEAKASELKKPVITRSLRSFIEKYNPKESWIINLSLNFETAYKDTKIKFMPAVDLIGS
ncbi:MAG: ATP-binding protein [Deltaproteobacteria bacterium]|nr:ATP-binding protein [Deltaproteobacteria bacterium]